MPDIIIITFIIIIIIIIFVNIIIIILYNILIALETKSVGIRLIAIGYMLQKISVESYTIMTP